MEYPWNTFFLCSLCETDTHRLAGRTGDSPVAIGTNLSEVGLLPSCKALRVSQVEEVEVLPYGEGRVLQLLIGGVAWHQCH